MKAVVVVIVVAGYGVAASLTGLTVGIYIGWQKRKTVDEDTIANLDKIVGQAITDRQTAITATAAAHAELLRREFAQRFCADIDREYQQLTEEER